MTDYTRTGMSGTAEVEGDFERARGRKVTLTPPPIPEVQKEAYCS
ncbi:MAG TPA: hypothetical protein VII58_10495 [Acidobacteriaceae bacterium]